MTKPASTAYRSKALAAARTDRAGRVQCAKCRRYFLPAQVDVDHRLPSIDGGTDDLSNLQVLCRRDHQAKTKREAARRKQGPLWHRVLTGGAFLGVLIPQRHRFTQWVTTGIPPDPRPAVLDAAVGLTVGVAVACVACVVLWVAREWWRMGALRDTPSPVETPTKIDRSARVEAAVRDLVGARGTVVARDTGHRIDVTYTGTGLAHEDDETRVRLIEKVAANIGGRWVGEWHTTTDTVVLSPRPEMPDRVPHPGLPDGRPWHVLPIANGTAFNLLKTPHLLIAGATGSGKTAAMRCLIEALAESARAGQCEVRLLDVKVVEMSTYRTLPGIHSVSTTDAAVYDALLDVETEMRRRYAAYEDGVSLDSHLPLVVVVDEARELMDRLNAEAAVRKESVTQARPSKARAALDSVLRLGRTARVHVILGTQRGDAKWLGGDTRDQLQGRLLVGPSRDGQSSRMCFGSAAYARDVPAGLKGRGTVQVGEHEPVEIQVFYTPPPDTTDPEEVAILARIRGLNLTKELTR